MRKIEARKERVLRKPSGFDQQTAEEKKRQKRREVEHATAMNAGTSREIGPIYYVSKRDSSIVLFVSLERPENGFRLPRLPRRSTDYSSLQGIVEEEEQSGNSRDSIEFQNSRLRGDAKHDSGSSHTLHHTIMRLSIESTKDLR
jgi:hypothetical protein